MTGVAQTSPGDNICAWPRCVWQRVLSRPADTLRLSWRTGLISWPDEQAEAGRQNL